MHIWSTDLWQWYQEYALRKGKFLQQKVLGKLDFQMQKNEIEPLFYTVHNLAQNGLNT